MIFPRVKKCLPFLNTTDNPVYTLDVITENEASRHRMLVEIPHHINRLINESKLVGIDRKTPEGFPVPITVIGEAVYAYRLLKKSGMVRQYQDILARSIEEERGVLDVAFEMVQFLEKLSG